MMPLAQFANESSRWGEALDTLRLIAPSMLTAAALAVGAGVAGVFVLLRREALVALALPQVATLGAAIGLRMGWPTLPPAVVAVLVGLVILALSRQRGAADALLPAMYLAGLCLALLVIANSGQHLADVQNRFTGADVMVTEETARVAAPLVLCAAVAFVALWRRWLLLAQAQHVARLAGRTPALWEALFLVLLSAVVLLGTDALGAVMVLALLFLPASAALPWARRLPAALAAAAALGLVLLAAGFGLSFLMDWPLSQSVGAAGVGAVVLSHAVASAVR